MVDLVKKCPVSSILARLYSHAHQSLFHSPALSFRSSLALKAYSTTHRRILSTADSEILQQQQLSTPDVGQSMNSPTAELSSLARELTQRTAWSSALWFSMLRPTPMR